jgi:hypothetical protein
MRRSPDGLQGLRRMTAWPSTEAPDGAVTSPAGRAFAWTRTTRAWRSRDHGAHAPLVIVSPHFDDAALSCVSLVARHPGAVLLTVFGAGPPRVNPITRWDRASGFAPGDDVIAVRAAEDLDACDALGARQVRLKHWD